MVHCPPLQTPNPQQSPRDGEMALRGSSVPCQMLEGAESLWTGSRGDPEGGASLSEQAAALPRQRHAPEVSSQPGPGKPTNTKGEGGKSLRALLQGQRSPCVCASLPVASAALNAIQEISASPLSLLQEKSIGSGAGISHRDAALQPGLLQSTASAPATLVPGWQVSPTIVSWSSKPRATAWLVLACSRGMTLPTTSHRPSDSEHSPQICFGGCPALLLRLEAWIILIQT